MMNNPTAAAIASHSFLSQFKGTFYGLLRWPELANFWDILKQKGNSGWYIYKVGELPPERPSSESDLLTFIDEIDILLKKLHDEDYCGVVYVDDRNRPSFVKIFHPKNMGYGMCSIEKAAPLPGWVLSTEPPIDLTIDHGKAENASFWQGMMATLSNVLLPKGT